MQMLTTLEPCVSWEKLLGLTYHRTLRSVVLVCRSLLLFAKTCLSASPPRSVLRFVRKKNSVSQLRSPHQLRPETTPPHTEKVDAVRVRNFMPEGGRTAYGQLVAPCHTPRIWSELGATAQVASRRAAAKEFNDAHRWRKRGIAVSQVHVQRR